MKEYYIDDFSNKKNYESFISYIAAFSDAFSLLYFQYNSDGRKKRTVRRIEKSLEPVKLYDENVNRWPGTETKNLFGHIYNLKTYRITLDSVAVLQSVNSIWDWDYPKYPMDLCFYKKGYAWFASSVHEHWSALYLDEPGMAADIASTGVNIELIGEIDEKGLYYDERLKRNAFGDGSV